jgi:hypothetical protein
VSEHSEYAVKLFIKTAHFFKAAKIDFGFGGLELAEFLGNSVEAAKSAKIANWCDRGYSPSCATAKRPGFAAVEVRTSPQPWRVYGSVALGARPHSRCGASVNASVTR